VLPAGAQQARPRELDGPRAAGQVGERYDGYAEARGGAPPGVVALVEQVNARRRTYYQQKAAEQHVAVDAIARIYAAQIIEHQPPGTWVLLENGKWQQK
jgi:uncharacterized protein YdbL (DUF1318 family)